MSARIALTLRAGFRARALATVATVGAGVALITGCATSHAASGPAAGTSSSHRMPMAPGMSMTPGMSMAPGMSMSEMGRQPSASARMVCSSEISHDVAEILALPAEPTGEHTWDHTIFTCTYRLATGPLTLSVEDSRSLTAGQAYFTALQERASEPRALRGLQSFGLPSFQTAAGTVAFLKDGKTLTVDATGQPSSIGPDRLSRGDLAYAVAADVIACWSE